MPGDFSAFVRHAWGITTAGHTGAPFSSRKYSVQPAASFRFTVTASPSSFPGASSSSLSPLKAAAKTVLHSFSVPSGSERMTAEDSPDVQPDRKSVV